MKECLTIGSAPHEENCAQVGEENYQAQGRKECKALGGQIVRLLGEPPLFASLVVKTFPHDFGSYTELCVVYDDNYPEAEEYAFNCESLPSFWDKEARLELGLD